MIYFTLNLGRLSLLKVENRWNRAKWPTDNTPDKLLLEVFDAHGPPSAPVTEEGFKELKRIAEAVTKTFDFNFTEYWQLYTKMLANYESLIIKQKQ